MILCEENPLDMVVLPGWVLKVDGDKEKSSIMDKDLDWVLLWKDGEGSRGSCVGEGQGVKSLMGINSNQ